MKNIFWILVLMLALPSSALANDTAFGGSGADVMPIKTPEVEMVREHIVIQADESAESWNVKVEFEFKNTSDKALTVLMGFPFHVADDESDTSPPPGQKSPKVDDPMVWNFTTTLRGKPLKKLKKQKLAKNHQENLYYRFAYVWDVTFAAGETVKVVNSYQIGMTMSSMGSLHANYTLKTGGMWKGGKIGRSQIELHGTADMIPCWTENYGPLVTPDGSSTKKNDSGGVSFHWDLKNHKPTKDVEVCFVSRPMFRSREISGMLVADLKSLSKKELRVLRNKVFALHGYKFKSKDLSTHFGKEPWYQVNPKFKNSDLSSEEVEFVNEVKTEERTR